MEELIYYLRKLREESGYTREDVANAINKSTGTYRDIEIGRIRLNLEDYLLICNFLKIPPTQPLEYLSKDKNIILIELTDEEMTSFRTILNKLNKSLTLQENKTDNQNITIGNNNNINNSFNS